MSGSAALAAARRRRVNNSQIQNNIGNLNDNAQNDLNKMVNNLETVENKPVKMSLGQIVMLHDSRINFIKKELDTLISNKNEINDKKTKVTFSDVNINSSIDELKTKIASIESNDESNNKKILELNNEIDKTKKDIENFKIIFLNINKVLNDLKTQMDTNNNEVNNMRTFLDNHQFVSNEDIVDNTIKEELDSIEENNQENNEPIRMVVQETS